MSDDFPSLDAYLALLPNGLASYPHMSAKASVLRTVVATMPCSLDDSAGLPPRLEELVRAPPPASGWVLEVELWALSLCIYDRAFAGEGGAAAHEAWAYTRNRALLGGPLYKVLFAVLSPERLFQGGAQRYATFHRGTVMSRVEADGGQGTFRLTTPPHVLPDIAHVSLATAFRAALDITGARDTRVVAHPESPEVVAFSASWR